MNCLITDPVVLYSGGELGQWDEANPLCENGGTYGCAIHGNYRCLRCKGTFCGFHVIAPNEKTSAEVLAKIEAQKTIISKTREPGPCCPVCSVYELTGRSPDVWGSRRKPARPNPDQPARDYKISETFNAGNKINHPKFGVGIVEMVDGNKITVSFPNGVHTLAHARTK